MGRYGPFTDNSRDRAELVPLGLRHSDTLQINEIKCKLRLLIGRMKSHSPAAPHLVRYHKSIAINLDSLIKYMRNVLEEYPRVDRSVNIMDRYLTRWSESGIGYVSLEDFENALTDAFGGL